MPSRVNHSVFQSLFPPPVYLSMPSVGINISDHSIKMLELHDAGDHLELGNYETLALPEGVVVGGKVKQQDVVVDHLKKLRDRFNLEFIRSSIPEEEGYIFSLSLQGIEEKDITSAIEFRLGDNVPLSTSEAVFDYSVIRKDKNVFDVNVAVLPRTVVEAHKVMYEKAGLTPLSLEIEAQTIARSVIKADSAETLVIVDMGRTRTGIAIADRQIVRYTSTLPTGGDAFASIISKEKGFSREEAEAIKAVSGVIPLEYDQPLATKLTETVDSLSIEIERQIEFWNGQALKHTISSLPVSGIVLCGGNATMPGLREALAGSLSLNVEIGNVWQNVFSLDEIIPPIDFKHSLGYASSIGIALMG